MDARRIASGLAAGLLAAATVAAAQVFKWTEADGTVHYGDRPPPGVDASELSEAGLGPLTKPEARRDAPTEASDGAPRWRHTISWGQGAKAHSKAVREQGRTGAPMLVYFRTDWCPYCRELDRKLESADLRRAVRVFIKVEINPEDGRPERRLFETYGGRGYPSLYLVEADQSPRRLRHGGTVPEIAARLRAHLEL